MDNFKIKVPGTKFYLESNKTYLISNRPDSSAPVARDPQGNLTHLPFKVENPNNTQNAFIPFDDKRKIWDTGFYESSPCYTSLKTDIEKKEAKETLKVLEKNLLPLLRMSMSEDDLNSHRNNRYWDSYKFPLRGNLIVSTDSPESFLGLWAAFLSGTIISEDAQKTPKARLLKVPFVINDRKKTANKAATLSFETDRAKARFLILLESENEVEREFLFDLLNYLGLRVDQNQQDAIVNSIFKNWIENKQDANKNGKAFTKALKHFSTEEGKEELEIYKNLRKAISEGRVEKIRSDYYLGESSIGANPKEAAKLINDSEELKELYLDILE